MRRYVAILLILSLSVTEAAEHWSGPRANPETQRHIMWLCQEELYPDIAAMGFDTVMNQVFGYALAKNEAGERFIEQRRARLGRAKAAGLDFIETLNGAAFNKYYRTKYPRLRADGTKANAMDVSDPACFDEILSLYRKTAATLDDDPSFVGLQAFSEVRDLSFSSITERWKREWARISGGQPLPDRPDQKRGLHYSSVPRFPVSRIVETNDVILTYWRWFWKDGDGWSPLESAVASAYESRFSSFGRRAYTVYDPAVRVPPIWGNGGTVNHLNHWVYVDPEPFNISYVMSECHEMARGAKVDQKVNGMVQAFAYRSHLAPEGKAPKGAVPEWFAAKPDAKYLTMPPDMVQEAIWTLFSHRLDAIQMHGCQALADVTRFGKKEGNYRYTNGRTQQVVSNLFNGVGAELGPLFKALPESGNEIAMVESYAASIFANRGGFGNGSHQLCDLGALATLACLQPRVLYEEDIAQNGIPAETKVLLMPHCDVLTRPTYEAVCAFQSKGGSVVGDKYLVPGILPDAMFPTYAKVGFAEKDTPVFRRAAKSLKDTVNELMPLKADVDRDDIFVRQRSLPGADYLFAINDRRGPDDYVGGWGKVWGKGLPNEGTITVKRPGTKAVYDLVRHAQVEFTLRNGRVSIPVRYETNDGRIYLLTDNPLSPLTVRWSDSGLDVTSEVKDAYLPIGVDFDNAKRPFYGCVRDGKWKPSFKIPAGARAVSVTDLATGDCTVLAAPKADGTPLDRILAVRKVMTRALAKNPSVRISFDAATVDDLVFHGIKVFAHARALDTNPKGSRVTYLHNRKLGPIPKNQATFPMVKSTWITDGRVYVWSTNGVLQTRGRFDPRLERKLDEVRMDGNRSYDLIMVGDSITHLFETGRGSNEWAKLKSAYHVLNLGFGGDHTENVVWNALHGGFLDGLDARYVSLMIGTNNRGESAEQVAEGIALCVKTLRKKVPGAKILLHPMIPRIDPKLASLRKKNAQTNVLIEKLADGHNVLWVDLRPFFEGEGVSPQRQRELLPDGTHPNGEAYAYWRERLQKILE